MTHDDDLRPPVDAESAGNEDVVSTEENIQPSDVVPFEDELTADDPESVSTDDALLQPEPEMEVVAETPAPEVPEAPMQENFWNGLWSRLFPSREAKREQVKQRLLELDAAIREHPRAASNYVVRGELYLDLGHYELALTDFQNALEIAIDEVENNRWGIVAQVLQDRALHGLNRAKRHLPHVEEHHA